MSETAAPLPESWTDRFRARLSHRAAGIVLALAIEVLILLALLSISLAPKVVSRQGEKLSVFSVSPSPEETTEPDQPPAPSNTQSAAQQPPVPQEAPKLARPDIPPLPWAEAPREIMEAADIAKPAEKPAKPAKPVGPMGPVMGPPDRGVPGDSQRVSGSGPNGEPLYGAAWYREPYDDELSGYLSTASGPGWALIACKTVADFRVEDCIKIDEYPAGSGMARAVLGAAWQFRVRPPRIGGIYRVGEWVRIRIDYNLRRK